MYAAFALRLTLKILKEPALEYGFSQWFEEWRWVGYLILASEFFDTIKYWICLVLVAFLIDSPTIEYYWEYILALHLCDMVPTAIFVLWHFFW